MTQPLTGYANSPLVDNDRLLEEARRKRKSAKDIVVYGDMQVQALAQWTAPQVINALDAHAIGQFNSSALLADAMGRDDAMDAVLQTRTLGLLSRPLEFQVAEQGNKVAARKAKQAAEDYFSTDMAPEDTLSEVHRWGIQFGFCVAQIVWHELDGLMIPSLQVWHPSLTWFNWASRTLMVNTTEGQQYVIPGTGQWFVYAPYGLYRGWIRGAMNSCAIPWLARQFAIRDWVRYSEVHGLPTRLVQVPARSRAEDKGAVAAAIAGIGNETTVLLPQPGDPNAPGWDISLLEATTDSWQGFQELINMTSSRMAIRVLGQNLTTEVDAGSLAAANVHDRVRLDYVRGDARTLGRSLQQFLLGPFCQFNFNDASVAPKPYWKVAPPEDIATKTAGYVNVSTAYANLKNATAPFDGRAFLDANGIPLIPEDEMPPEMPAAPIAPTPPDAPESPKSSDVKGPDVTETLARAPHWQRRTNLAAYIWKTTGDAEVRPMHAALDGTTQSWDDPPVVNEDGDRLNPGEDFNCRCVAVPKFI